MSVTPVNPVLAATLPADLVGQATPGALSAIVQAVSLAETATLLELAAPGQPPTASPGPAPANPVAQAADAARTAAAVRQGSLAPLLANLAQVANSPALPPALKAAVAQVLALQLPTEAPVTGETLKQAVSQSGLFLEAHLAAAPATAGQAPAPDLKGALLVLQRALADVAAPEAEPAAPGASPTPAAPPPQLTPETLKQAVVQSLPVFEAQLATPQAAAAAPPDLRTALALVEPDVAQASAEPPAAPGAGPAPTPARPALANLPDPVRAAIVRLVAQQPPPGVRQTPATVRQAVAKAAEALETYVAKGAPLPADAPPDLREAVRTLQRALAAASTPDAGPAGAPRVAVPPPHRQAAPAAQAAARPTLPADAEPADIVQHLKGQVTQAVARQTLHQLASLPEGSAPSWMFELPLATPQGASIAQFVIDRDAEGSGGGETQAATWRARFSIDVEPLGPVHVHLRMVGDEAAVTVWAERPESLDQLRGEGAALAKALPGEVTFRGGSPPQQPGPATGRFLDQTS